MNAYHERTYRSLVENNSLETYRVVVKETDLLIKTQPALEREATDFVLKHRLPLERYVEAHPGFLDTLEPFPVDPFASPIVKSMIDASRKAQVGPMAAVAGAIAEYVGKDLKALSREVVVENGGDVFLHTATPQTIAIFAGESPLSNKIGIRVEASRTPMGVCTSSGTIGHSLSLGKADAVVVLSRSACLADAAATAIGNRVSGKGDLASGIRFGQKIKGVEGLVIILGDELGIWGEVELLKI
jgi:ApbE superfamily uncharacterized protein (UPF0280 family)